MPEPPHGLEYLWSWYEHIITGLDAGGFAPSRITWATLRHWQACTGHTLQPWECDCILAIHSEWLACEAARAKAREAAAGVKK